MLGRLLAPRADRTAVPVAVGFGIATPEQAAGPRPPRAPTA